MIFHSQEGEHKNGDKWESIQPYDFKTVADFETDHNGKYSLKQKETKKINLTKLTGACAYDKSNVYRVFFRPIIVCNTLFEGDNDLTIFEFNLFFQTKSEQTKRNGRIRSGDGNECRRENGAGTGDGTGRSFARTA